MGVVSSKGTSVPCVGAPASSPTVAGAGTGMRPWAERTMPVPVATLLACTSSMPSTPSAAQVPTTSMMLSMAPTSWKCTCDGGRLWSRPSTSARALNVASARRVTRSGRSASSIMAVMFPAVRWTVVSSAWTRALVAARPQRSTGSNSSFQPPTGSRSRSSTTSSPSAPASTSAPSAMAPAIPEKQWNQARRVTCALPVGAAQRRRHRSRCRCPPRSGPRHTRPASPGGP